MEALKLINADLDRLYLTGVDDEYFQEARRKKMLRNILLIWSARHEHISYRQGMHEIAGIILLVVELESTHSNYSVEIRSLMSQDNVEHFTFWIFERIMKDLSPLYDPLVDSVEQQPAIVQYCTNIQGISILYL